MQCQAVEEDWIPIPSPYFPAATQEVQTPDVDLQEQLCLQKNIYYEARGEGVEGMKAVAAVVMNRTKSGRFPDTACGVVYQKYKKTCQFSWVCHPQKVKMVPTLWDEAGEIARDALSGQLIHRVGAAMFFHNRHIRPRWASQMTRVATISGHIFYRYR
jgi:spore germination cell wall hydrolase CwlJ-like protein